MRAGGVYCMGWREECVPIALAITALGNLSFVLWWFKFNFTLLKELNIKYILMHYNMDTYFK
jgi:hypothetical protein